MKWMKERDLLIAQTMAFVQSVTGKTPDLVAKPDAVAPFEAVALADAPRPVVVGGPMPDVEAMLAETIAVEPRQPAPIARPEARVDFQSEIRARVANFRAHQERFSREREAYCSDTMAKVHASIKESELPPRLGN